MTTYVIGNIGYATKIIPNDIFWSRFPGPPAPHSLRVLTSGVVEEQYEFRTDQITSEDTYAFFQGGQRNLVVDDVWLATALLVAGYTLEEIDTGSYESGYDGQYS